LPVARAEDLAFALPPIDAQRPAEPAESRLPFARGS